MPHEGHDAVGRPAPSFTEIAQHYDDLMKDVPYAAWVRYVLMMASRYGCDPERILDLACGTGTVSLMLAARGFQVTGVDGSEPMLEVARQKAADAGIELPFIHSDLRSFSVSDQFDLALCLYDSLNNILEPEGIGSVFERVSKSLNPGGLFIFDVNTDYALRANLFSQEHTAPNAPIQYRWNSTYDYSTRICTIEMAFWVLEDGRRRHFQEVHYQRAYSQTDLDRMLRSAGLIPLGVFDGLTLRGPQPRTDRMYCVSQRDA